MGGRSAAAAAGLAAVAILSMQTAAVASHSLIRGGNAALHWDRSGTALAQVYYVDHTGSRWPVARNVYDWNASNRVKSYYETTCPNSSVHCVHVRTYDSNDGNIGYTHIEWDSNGHFVDGGVWIRLNNYPSTTFTARDHTACQELGHALGLDHQYSDNTCMNDNRLDTVDPNQHDYDQLASVYDH